MTSHDIGSGIDVVYAKFGLRAVERWCDAPIRTSANADLALLQYYSKPPQGAVCSAIHSLELPLSATEDQLLAGIDSGSRYEIRRAGGKDKVTCEYPVTDLATVEAFARFYDDFAAAKGLPPMDQAELDARAKAGLLHLSRALVDGELLAWHAHVVSQSRVVLLHSASAFRASDDKAFRALVGRANRLLHWEDIRSFKRAGLAAYDFGGWYAGSEDEALLSINRFKEGFGGVRVALWNGGVALSWRGWLFLQARRLFNHAQRKRISALLGTLKRRAPTSRLA